MKHDHKKTKKLKVALYAMFMFLPFIAIGITCLTHVFNEKIAEETETATINNMYKTKTPTNVNDFTPTYMYELKPNTNAEYSQTYKFLNMVVYENQTKIYEQYRETNNYYARIENNKIYYDSNDPYQYINITQNTIILFVADYTEDTDYYYETDIQQYTYIAPTQYIPIKSVTITTNPQDQTTNIFYDSCDQVKQSFILNWCDNENPINTGLANFTQVFNIPNDNIINTLLTYMLSITMIYIVIDIIIETITYITHFFNKEI